MLSPQEKKPNSPCATRPDFSNSLETFKFEQRVLEVTSKINASSVREFTPEQLSEAKLALNSILATGLLPPEIAEKISNSVAALNEEFKRREEEAKKQDEEERKKREEEERKKKCQTERQDCA